MDYEKKYKEALKRAKEWKEGKYGHQVSDTPQEIAEFIFPELKESDDERIRKWIIDDIRYNMNNEPLNDSEYKKKAEKAIAWLEKQGEQKPVDKSASVFTIQDAKDGDVLCSPSHHYIWIYKGSKQYYACVNMNYATENIYTNGSMVIPKDVYPATKDEQTILFERMKEAGYEWDADKKELINKLENRL